MLTRHNSCSSRLGRHDMQHGVVLVIALIILVAMTLAGIALVRSVDTTNVIAGNLAFQQAATQSGDNGVEQAIRWLENNNNGVTLNSTDTSNGYWANGNDPSQKPSAGQSWDAFWRATLSASAVSLGQDTNTGNTVSYVIQRLCSAPGAASAVNCSASPATSGSSGNEEEAGNVQLNALSSVYYRITARIDGPRNTVSYIQAIVTF